MSDLEVLLESILEHMLDTLNHKKFVIIAALKMCDYLIVEGKEDLAKGLIFRANIHDNSKLVEKEMSLMASLYGTQSTFEDPNKGLDDFQTEIIACHWSNNRHHPEHFVNKEEMTELDMIEMVCDWYARSLQYGTDFLNFVSVRQETRFKFSEKQFSKIWFYCVVLDREVSL